MEFSIIRIVKSTNSSLVTQDSNPEIPNYVKSLQNEMSLGQL